MEAIASADPFLAQLAAGLGARSKSRRALVAVSGGRDSVALLHGLHALGFRNLTILHLDHQLRGRASSTDARFVAGLSKKLGFLCIVGHADVRGYAKERGLSLEHAARELRHVFFASLARRERCRTVLLAHHADDQIETCLHNFLRGTGAAGLAGMRPETKFVVGRITLVLLRPMLGIRRSAIDAFVAAHGVKFREDVTNAETSATRNRIRHQVLPAIREATGGSFAEAILRTALILDAEDAWLQAETNRISLVETLPLALLRAHPLALQRRLIRRWLAERGVAEPGLAEVERVRSLLDVSSGPAKINLPAGRHARRRAGRIFLEQA